MSHFATPFIVVNLGCEMIFVIDQRLKAQNIAMEKCEKVLTDIVTVLLHPKLLDELFIPQPVATQTVVKQLLDDISTTSIMRLDEYSLSKLWDLMTMIFKWQLSTATIQNIFDISRRHLRSVAALMPRNYSKDIIENAIKRFGILAQDLSDEDYKCLSNTVIFWFNQYHAKISVLLRLGLQRKDGTFCLPVSINPNIIKNLGENIYKYDSKKKTLYDYETCSADSNEINCILESIESIKSKSKVQIQLPIEFGNDFSTKQTLEIERNMLFESISTNVKTNTMDLRFSPEMPKSTQEDLLQMLDDFDN
ncbi:protein OSCP1 [Bombyx mandarina]|uniref:Protein OSCP1 n=1 Tax=Bombyx mandarina TaxID=7092 RepID=A0A6J2KFP6_BOMMA|nr:protein OSCP1 [Bombyx mandarina]